MSKNQNTELSPSVFESYNARWISAKKIAESFIPPKAFKEIAKPANTIIVGPRGSGKTSILKMLQTSALENWNDPEADQYRASINYTGVFIPADIVWSKQFKALGAGHLRDEQCESLRVSVFTGQILQSLLKAFMERLNSNAASNLKHRHVTLNHEQERELVLELSKAWYVEPELPTIKSFNRALRKKVDEIWEFANKERHLHEEGRSERFGENSFLSLDPFKACYSGIEIINEISNDSDGLWALLFDELEIAPSWVTDRLKQQLRSHAPNVLLKLSLSPYTPINFNPESSSAMKDQDYTIVPLWHKYKHDAIDFSERLFTNLIQKKLQTAELKAVDILGLSRLNGDYHNKDSEEAYSFGSKHQKLIEKLYDEDLSVREFFDKKSINVQKLPIGKEKGATLVRKIFPTLVIRDFFLKPGSSGVNVSRGRKVYKIYSGSDTFLAATESNPRWIIGVTSKLLNDVNSSPPKFAPSEQAKHLDIAAQSFCTLLKTIPVESKFLQRGSSLLNLLDKIGGYFHECLMSENFKAEPISTFIVDDSVGEEIESALGIALNAGAIVYVNDNDEELILERLKGKRFRLSYLLCPQYKINTRLGPPINLSKIMNIAQIKNIQPDEDSQISLL